ncbi:MAG: FAD-dependent oxidoreductase [Acidobacteriota bacterium]|nr:FAD-dependent oxidoreductase [Acidobacteriota bacterium]MDE3147805.1 FAD-dependent oxidoreductase [Acidobacteriota bacterium]
MDDKDSFVLRHLSELQPDLWWLDSDPLEPEARSSLIGDVRADLCVVGAGYTGLWTALLAKERDPERVVVVVEQYETGAGASGRNGGFCSASLTHGFGNGMRRFPAEMRLIEELGRENLDEIEATVRRYGIECDFERTGELRVAVEPWQLEGMAEEARLRNEMGDHVEVLSREEVRARIHSPLYEGGIFDPDGTALVDPARLVWGLERACLALGVTIHENSKVLRLEDVAEGVRVHAPYGTVTASKVALATNVFPSLVRSARKYVVPVFDYQLVTEPLSAAQRESIGWAGREGVSDAGNQFHYYRLTHDGCILWGGYDAIYNFRGKVQRDYEFNAATYATLASHFLKTFPQLAGIKFTHGWGGAIDTCTRFSPFWGTAHRGRVAYVMGFTGLGVGATRFGAQTMLDLLDGHDTTRTRLAMVRRKPLPFPPEPLRWLFIRLTQLSIRHADENQGHRNLWLRLLDRLGLGFDS